MTSRTRVAALTAVLLAGWFGGVLATRGWNPSTLIAAGVDDVRVAQYVEQQLGPDFEFQSAWGHDGKFVFIQAHDPLLLEPEVHAAALDAPVYRSQRFLVPAVTAVGGLFGPWGYVWAVPAMMVVAVAMGAWATAGLAQRAGRSVWWGMAFALNPGLFYAYRRGTVDVVAVALLILGVYFVASNRPGRAAATLALSALAKEVMVLGAIGIAWHRRTDGRRALLPALVPVLAVAGWGTYVRFRLGSTLWSAGADVASPPLVGLGRVLTRLPSADSLVALVVAGLALVTVVQAWRRPGLAATAAAGFCIQAVLLPEAVWAGYVDAWRVAAPIIALQTVALLTGERYPWRRPVPVASFHWEREPSAA